MPPYTCSDCYCLQPKKTASHLDTVHATSSGFLHSCTQMPWAHRTPKLQPHQSPGKHNKVTQLCMDFLFVYWVFVPCAQAFVSCLCGACQSVLSRSRSHCTVCNTMGVPERGTCSVPLGSWEALNVQWVCSVTASRTALQTQWEFMQGTEKAQEGFYRVQPSCTPSRSFVTSSAVSSTSVLTQEAPKSVRICFPSLAPAHPVMQCCFTHL